MLANLKVAISEVSRWPMLRCWWQRRVEAKKLAMGIARVCPESLCFCLDSEASAGSSVLLGQLPLLQRKVGFRQSSAGSRRIVGPRWPMPLAVA
eukprot:COSAG06_NODE_283_length_18377_cov_8.509301_4_plen_94_part_00